MYVPVVELLYKMFMFILETYIVPLKKIDINLL